MEINISHFFANAAPMDYSASVAEIGRDAGPSTWQAANDDSADYPLIDTDEKREAFRAFVRASGGWNAEEIAAFSDQALNALCIQWVSGDIREAGIDTSAPDWAEYEIGATEGQHASRLYCADDGSIYFSLAE